MKEYNGHRSWNAWNVSLWISNDEPLYRAVCETIEKAKKRARPGSKPEQIASETARQFSLNIIPFGNKTPDGAVYNRLSVKLAILGLME